MIAWWWLLPVFLLGSLHGAAVAGLFAARRARQREALLVRLWRQVYPAKPLTLPKTANRKPQTGV